MREESCQGGERKLLMSPRIAIDMVSWLALFCSVAFVVGAPVGVGRRVTAEQLIAMMSNTFASSGDRAVGEAIEDRVAEEDGAEMTGEGGGNQEKTNRAG